MEEPVLSWSLLLAPRHYQGLQLSHNQQGAGPGLEPELEEIDLCLPTSFVSFQLATDHTTKAEAKQDDGRALPTLRAQTVTPGARPCTSAMSYNTLPHGPAPSPWDLLLLSCRNCLRSRPLLAPDGATPVQKPSNLTDPTAPSDSLYACCPSFYLGLRTAATSPHRPWHIVGAQ